MLDRILVDAARSAGADVRHGVVLSRLQIDNKGQVIGALLSNADGHSTPVRSIEQYVVEPVDDNRRLEYS